MIPLLSEQQLEYVTVGKRFFSCLKTFFDCMSIPGNDRKLWREAVFKLIGMVLIFRFEKAGTDITNSISVDIFEIHMISTISKNQLNKPNLKTNCLIKPYSSVTIPNNVY